MVTYFNKKDLVAFGNYLLSDKRRESFKSHPQPVGTLEDRLKQISHADVENFLESIKKI